MTHPPSTDNKLHPDEHTPSHHKRHSFATQAHLSNALSVQANQVRD